MSKIDFLRRILLGCFTFTTTANTATPPRTTTTTTATTTTSTTTKKRLSTSLRDDIISDYYSFAAATTNTTTTTPSSPSPSSSDSDIDAETSSTISHHTQLAPPRASKSMVICTFFGPRSGPHVWFSVQPNRLSPKPTLLLELSLSTRNLVKEMQCGILRIALECKNSEFRSCPLHLVPVWTTFCNGRPVGFATRRKPSSETRELLRKMQSITMGAGVIHAEETENSNDKDRRELMYMRATYEWVIGGADSESFHLISPDENSSDQELSVFLLRSH